MTADQEEFADIVVLLAQIGPYWGRVQVLREIGPDLIRRWDTQIKRHRVQEEEDLVCIPASSGSRQRYLHNTQGPAIPSTLSYYLFDSFIHQEDWFDVLGMREEERLFHMLKWGRQ